GRWRRCSRGEIAGTSAAVAALVPSSFPRSTRQEAPATGRSAQRLQMTLLAGREGKRGNAPFEPMTRQDTNEAFLLTSFLYGGNADYIEELYARYEADPASVDESWASFFAGLKDAPEDISKNASGPSWKRRDWPRPANGDLV